MSLHNIAFHWLTSGFTLLAVLAVGAKYRKFPKYLDAQNICCNHCKIFELCGSTIE